MKASDVTVRAGIALGAAVILVAVAIPSYHLTVRDDGGTRLWMVAIAPGTPVTLAYENSIYHAPTEELLTADAHGFSLQTVRSTSEAVLAYNGLEAPYRRTGVWYESDAPRRLPVLAVRIGRTGRQFLVAGRRTVPLYEAGEGVRLQIAVERAPRVVAVLRAWAPR